MTTEAMVNIHHPDPAVDTLASIRNEYATRLKAEHKAAKTITLYVNAMDGLAAYQQAHGMPQGLRAIKADHVAAFIEHRLTVVSATTANLEYRALRRLFNWCSDEGLITKSPMAKMRAPRIIDSPPPVLAMEALSAMLATCKGRTLYDTRDAAMLRLLIDTGMRRGELASITVDDIDWTEHSVSVTGKTGRHRVGFGASTAVAMHRYARVRSHHRLAALPAFWLGHGDVPVGPSGVSQIVATRAKLAGIPRFGPHRFRHTWAHEMTLAGVAGSDMQAAAGWKSPAMLARYGRSAAEARAIPALQKNSIADRL